MEKNDDLIKCREKPLPADKVVYAISMLISVNSTSNNRARGKN
jgi:hypothetical protein